MKRPTFNILIDLAAALLFFAMLVSGYVLRYPLPVGTQSQFHLWGLNRHQWGDLHFWVSAGFLAILLTHLALHWPWIASVISRRLGWTSLAAWPRSCGAAAGILVLLTVFAIFAWIMQMSVREEEGVRVQESGVSEDKKAEAKPPPPEFWENVYPILKDSCLSCHGPQKARGDFCVDRREDFFKDDKPLILPGKSADSPFIAIISGQRVVSPPTAHKLPEHDVKIIRDWIDAGAVWRQGGGGKGVRMTW